MAKKIGVLWQKKKDGKTYLTGNIEVIAGMKLPVVIFRNDKKKQGSNQPDWNVMISEPQKTEQVKVEKVVDEL